MIKVDPEMYCVPFSRDISCFFFGTFSPKTVKKNFLTSKFRGIFEFDQFGPGDYVFTFRDFPLFIPPPLLPPFWQCALPYACEYLHLIGIRVCNLCSLQVNVRIISNAGAPFYSPSQSEGTLYSLLSRGDQHS